MAEINALSLLSDPNLEAYYRHESGQLTTDSSGNGVTLTNTNTVGQTTGKYGDAADFSASNSNKYLIGNTDLGIGGGAISIVGWVKLNAEISSGEWAFFMQEDASTHVRYDVRYEYNSGTRRLVFNRAKMNVADQDFTYNLTMGTADFYHIALTYDGSTLRGYVNGSEVGFVNASGDGAAVGVDSIKIGVSDNGSSLEAYASIIADDVAYFSRALSEIELTQINDLSSSNGGASFLLNFI